MADSDMSDVEDDPSEVESASEKHKWFQEEVSGLINKSLKDPVAFECIIRGELECISRAHSQSHVGLNKEVVRTMIYLPFSENFGFNGDLEKYSSTFNKVLEKYDPLLDKLNKNRPEGVDYVTTPFLELIRSEKLDAADWSTNKVELVLNALENHYIIEEVQIKELLAVIRQGIGDIANQRNVQPMEMEQQREAEQQSPITFVTDAAAGIAPVPGPTPVAVEVEFGGHLVSLPAPAINFPLETKLKVRAIYEPPYSNYEMSFDIMTSPLRGRQFDCHDVQMPTSTSRQELKEKDLYTIAKQISPRRLMELAVTQLEIERVEVEQIEQDHRNNCRDQIFYVLCLWHDRLQSRGGARAQLITALRACAFYDAANVLISNG